jgi:hypothetical protein
MRVRIYLKGVKLVLVKKATVHSSETLSLKINWDDLGESGWGTDGDNCGSDVKDTEAKLRWKGSVRDGESEVGKATTEERSAESRGIRVASKWKEPWIALPVQPHERNAHVS